MTNKPTDHEIAALAVEINKTDWNDAMDALICFARAVLDKWGQPAHSGEPVAWLHKNRLGEVQAFTSEPPPSLKAKCQALYTAQPAERGPLPPERVKEIVLDAGYDQCDIPDSERAAFIDGLRHGEEAHGIKGGQHGT